MEVVSDLVATWQVPMSDKMYKIEFEHGIATGKRILRVDEKEVVRHDWMFKLVGREMFELNGVRCAINIDAVGILAYEYSLTVGGQTFEKFREQQKKSLQIWHVRTGEEENRVCLEKDTMDVWVNGTKVNTTDFKGDCPSILLVDVLQAVQGEFADEGTKTHFELATAESSAYILSESSGNRHIGMVHRLFVNDNLVKPSELVDERGENNAK